MDNEIKNEQLKLANHFSKLTIDEKEKQGLALMCWLQGYEAGFQSAKQEELKKADDR